MNGKNPEYLLLVHFEGVERARMLGDPAQRIHDAYMERFGEAGALTLFALELEGDYDVVIRYQGPEESVGWLEDAIVAAAASAGGRAQVTTPVVVADLTERY